MNIKHLLILLLVNCGQEATASNNHTHQKTVSPNTVESNLLLTTNSVNTEFSFSNIIQSTGPVVTCDLAQCFVTRFNASQIGLTNKKIVVSDYVKSVILKLETEQINTSKLISNKYYSNRMNMILVPGA